MESEEIDMIIMGVGWRRRVVTEMVKEGIAVDVIRRIVNGVIDDVISDERSDAYNDGMFNERITWSE